MKKTKKNILGLLFFKNKTKRKLDRCMYNVLDVCHFIIKYSNEKGYGVSNLKLQKLLYFVQAYFLISKSDGTPCFSERIEAWGFGPVVPEAYKEYKMFGANDIPDMESRIEYKEQDIWHTIKRIKYNDAVISEEDKKLIKEVVDKFSDSSASYLVELTHNQNPWINAYVPSKNNTITNQSIKEYFS